MLVSGTFQSLPGVNVEARDEPAVPARRRRPAAVPGHRGLPHHRAGPGLWQRLNQIDIRVAKILRFGRTRTTVGFDVYNLLNTDVVTGQNNTYTPVPWQARRIWQVPNLILQARFVKFSIQVDF